MGKDREMRKRWLDEGMDGGERAGGGIGGREGWVGEWRCEDLASRKRRSCRCLTEGSSVLSWGTSDPRRRLWFGPLSQRERERERERGNTLAVSHHSAWQSNVPDGEMCL